MKLYARAQLVQENPQVLRETVFLTNLNFKFTILYKSNCNGKYMHMKQYQKNVFFPLYCLLISQVYAAQPPCDVDFEFNTTTKLCTACVSGAVSLGGIAPCSCRQGTSSLYSEPLSGAAVGPVLATKLTGLSGYQFGDELFSSGSVVYSTNGISIYFAPQHATYVGVYNIETNTFLEISIVDKINVYLDAQGVEKDGSGFQAFQISNDRKYSGAVYVPTKGNVYLIPLGLAMVGVVDISTNTFSTIKSVFSGQTEYNGGVLSQDGTVIYMVPFRHDYIGVLNLNTHAITKIMIGANQPNLEKYQGGVLAGNGKIYFCPYHSTNIGVLDPTAGDAFSVIDISSITHVNTDGYNTFEAIFLHTDSMIYFVPGAGTMICKLDPSTHIFSEFLDLTSFFTSHYWFSKTKKFSGGISVGMDKIYLIPSTSYYIGILTLFPTPMFEFILDENTAILKYSGGVRVSGTVYMVPANMNNIDILDLNLPVLSSCASCLAGTYSSLPGSDTCTTCPSYSSSPLDGLPLDRCLCDAGYTGADSGVCTACISGTTKTTIGSAPCVESSNTGAAGSCERDVNGFCKSCLPGTFSIKDTTADHCTPCPAGTWSSKYDARGVASCIFCRPGKFSTGPGMISVASCQHCPEGTFHTKFGAIDAAKCQTCSCR
jgi:hypothetical protein